VVDAADPMLTFAAFLDEARVPRALRETFVEPFFLAQWCVELEEFRQFSAYNVLKYAVGFYREGDWRGPRISEVDGGIGRYVAALARALTRVDVRLGAAPAHVAPLPGGGYRVTEAGGRPADYDHLLLATDAATARELLADVPAAEPARRVLDRVGYFKTVIAVHSDARLMPARREHWSVVNTRWDGRYSQNTIWKPWRSRQPVLRSWVTYDREMPEPLHALVTYRHGKIDLLYFQAQRDLAALQGQANLWFAGLYTHDIDSHESAVVSALKVAERLAPQAANLLRLRGAA
jgi:predicted NAD/FAD-binding protein